MALFTSTKSIASGILSGSQTWVSDEIYYSKNPSKDEWGVWLYKDGSHILMRKVDNEWNAELSAIYFLNGGKHYFLEGLKEQA